MPLRPRRPSVLPSNHGAVVAGEDHQRFVRAGRAPPARAAPRRRSSRVPRRRRRTGPAADLPRKRSDGNSGTCTSLCARYRKNGRVAIALDEADRGPREVGRQRLLCQAEFGREFLVVAPQRDRELVVRVRDALEEVEAVARRQEAERRARSRRGATCRRCRWRSPRRFSASASVISESGSPLDVRIVEVARRRAREPMRGRVRGASAMLERDLAREDHVGNAGAHRVAAGEQAGARRRADRARWRRTRVKRTPSAASWSRFGVRMARAPYAAEVAVLQRRAPGRRWNHAAAARQPVRRS